MLTGEAPSIWKAWRVGWSVGQSDTYSGYMEISAMDLLTADRAMAGGRGGKPAQFNRRKYFVSGAREAIFPELTTGGSIRTVREFQRFQSNGR